MRARSIKERAFKSKGYSWWFRFDIEPVEQARPRATRFGKGIRLYDPAKVKRYKQALGALAKERINDDPTFPLEGPLRVELKFFRPVQQSLSQKERARRLSGAHRPTVKPDLSNLLKSLEDALNGIVWVDDSQIVEEELCKSYSENPHVEMGVSLIGD